MLYEIYGNLESEQVIVALPALGERKEMYKELANQLKEYKMIAFDLPGHNQAVQDDYSIATYIEFIKKTLDELEVSSAHFIGNSIGGWIIQEMYSVYPEKVSSLLLLDGGFYFLGDREDMDSDEEIQLPIVEKFEDLQAAINEMVYEMEGLSVNTYSNLNSYMLGNFVLKNDVYMHHSNEEALNSLNQEILHHNYCLQANINIPFNLLIAKNNLDEISHQKLQQFKNTHSSTKVKVIENGYHFLPITNPKEVAEFIRTTL